MTHKLPSRNRYRSTNRSNASLGYSSITIQLSTRKVFLILDSLKVHHNKPVKAWAAKNVQKVELFYLSNYSPELNPKKRLNTNLKHIITPKMPVRTKMKLKATA